MADESLLSKIMGLGGGRKRDASAPSRMSEGDLEQVLREVERGSVLMRQEVDRYAAILEGAAPELYGTLIYGPAGEVMARGEIGRVPGTSTEGPSPLAETGALLTVDQLRKQFPRAAEQLQRAGYEAREMNLSEAEAAAPPAVASGPLKTQGRIDADIDRSRLELENERQRYAYEQQMTASVQQRQRMSDTLEGRGPTGIELRPVGSADYARPPADLHEDARQRLRELAQRNRPSEGNRGNVAELAEMVMAIEPLLDEIERLDTLLSRALIIVPCHALEHEDLHAQGEICEYQLSAMGMALIAGVELAPKYLPRKVHSDCIQCESPIWSKQWLETGYAYTPPSESYQSAQRVSRLEVRNTQGPGRMRVVVDEQGNTIEEDFTPYTAYGDPYEDDDGNPGLDELPF